MLVLEVARRRMGDNRGLVPWVIRRSGPAATTEALEIPGSPAPAESARSGSTLRPGGRDPMSPTGHDGLISETWPVNRISRAWICAPPVHVQVLGTESVIDVAPSVAVDQSGLARIVPALLVLRISNLWHRPSNVPMKA